MWLQLASMQELSHRCSTSVCTYTACACFVVYIHRSLRLHFSYIEIPHIILCILYNLYFTGCLNHQLLLANGDEQEFAHKDETELDDDTELTGSSGRL